MLSSWLFFFGEFENILFDNHDFSNFLTLFNKGRRVYIT